MHHTFIFSERDAVGCTNLSKRVFSDILGLTHKQPLKVRRVTGEVALLDIVKCTSSGRKFYQVDLADVFDISVGAKVTLIQKEKKNEVTMVVVEPPEKMLEKHGVVDAIVDLQHRLDELEHDVYEEDDDEDHEEDDVEIKEEGDHQKFIFRI